MSASSSASLVWFWITTWLLAILLYFPVHRLIWVMRVRRLEARTGNKPTDEAIEALRVKTRIVAGLIVLTFAYLFNHVVSSFSVHVRRTFGHETIRARSLGPRQGLRCHPLPEGDRLYRSCPSPGWERARVRA